MGRRMQVFRAEQSIERCPSWEARIASVATVCSSGGELNARCLLGDAEWRDPDPNLGLP